MAYVGGIRVRLIDEALYRLVYDSLETLGWFDADRAHEPVTLTPKRIDDDDEIKPNVISITDSDDADEEAEMGSNLTDFHHERWIDVYAEDDAIGKHLAHDIKAILAGRFSTQLGRTRPILEVVDYLAATPSVIFTCDLESIQLEKAVRYTKDWQKHHYVIVLDVVDRYGDEEDD